MKEFLVVLLIIFLILALIIVFSLLVKRIIRLAVKKFKLIKPKFIFYRRKKP